MAECYTGYSLLVKGRGGDIQRLQSRIVMRVIGAEPMQ